MPHAHTKYIIEARTPDGKLDLTGEQPEEVFGMRAIHGITIHEIADVVQRRCPELPLSLLAGDEILTWAAHIDSRFKTRIKTW